MKRLAFALLVTGVFSAGCTVGGDGQFDVHWTLTSDLGDFDCAGAGVDTIVVTSQGASDYIDLFDCTDGFNATSLLPVDTYTVWIDALDSGDNLVAQSNSQVASIDDDGDLVTINFDVDIPVDAGFFELSWNLVDDATDAALTCAEAVAGGVELISTPVGSTGAGLSDIFDCTAGSGVTAGLPLDTYTVVVELLEEGTDLSLGTSNPRTETLDQDDEVVDLGNFEFGVEM